MTGGRIAAVALAAAALAWTTSGGDRPSETARLDALLEPYVDASLYAGVVLVARGDSVTVTRAYGLADRSLGTPMSTAYRFQIGSITKDITAAAVRRLARDGLVAIDTPAARYVPALRAHPDITIRHLLDHTHGLPDWPTLPDARFRATRHVPLAETVAWLGHQDARFSPGTRGEYGSTGYLILARLIEVVSGESYERFVTRRILRPAGMRETGPRRDPLPTSGLVKGYVSASTPGEVRDPRYVDPGMGTGTSSLVSSAGDLLRWSRAPGVRRTWAEGAEGGRSVRWASGMTGGYVARIHHYPADDLTIVFLSNVNNAAFRPLLPAIAEIFLGATGSDRAKPHPPSFALGDDIAREALLGRFLCEGGFAFAVDRHRGGLSLRVASESDEAFAAWPLDSLRFFVPTDFATVTIERLAEGGRRATYEGGFRASCTVGE